MIKEAIGKKALSLFSEIVTASVKEKLEVRKLNRSIQNFYTRLSNLRRTKTIWSGDSEIDIQTVYVEPKVQFGEKTLIFKSLSSFPATGNFVITGIAGEGKSTLLKMLSSMLIDFNEGVPVFIELRKIKKGESIFGHVISFLDIMGAAVSKQLLEYLISEGRLILFLDAFDEVPDEIRDDIANEILALSQKHSNIRIIISSRPGTNIEYLQNFTKIKLLHLEGNEYLRVIDKLCHEKPDYKQTLINDIKSSGFKASELLLTPLMVTILILVHQALGKLPTTLPSYYELLFDVLLSRHDDIKITCRRKRSSGLNDEQLRRLFEAMSYELNKLGYASYNKETMHESVNKALRQTGISGNVDTAIKDYKSITSLIVEESGIYNYLHNSIREYFAASYIRYRPEDSKYKFYSSLLKNHSESYRWQHVLSFLDEIDSYYYNKFYKKSVLDEILPDQNSIPEDYNPTTSVIEKFNEFFPIRIRKINNELGKEEFSTAIAINFPILFGEYGQLFAFAWSEQFQTFAKSALDAGKQSEVTWMEAALTPEVGSMIKMGIREYLIKLSGERNKIVTMLEKHAAIIASLDDFDL
jgi:energy-coupling factor transporter ATP-binding protein EcfA2